MEENALEEFMTSQQNNYNKIDDNYKLFEVVTTENPSQILRYSQQQRGVEPLWMSD